MSKKVTKCKKCHQEILQAKPSQCPYCGSKEFVSEDETQIEAEETELKTGTVKSIGMQCPYCEQKQTVSSKLEEVTCPRCRKKYKIPEKAIGLLH